MVILRDTLPTTHASDEPAQVHRLTHSATRLPLPLESERPAVHARPLGFRRPRCRICLYGIKAPLRGGASLATVIVLNRGEPVLIWDGAPEAEVRDHSLATSCWERAGWPRRRRGETGGGTLRAPPPPMGAALASGAPPSQPARSAAHITAAKGRASACDVHPKADRQHRPLPDLPLTGPRIVHGAAAASRAAHGRGPLAPTATIATRCPPGTLDTATAPEETRPVRG